MNICKRDEHGWRVPTLNTKARVVYDMMIRGATLSEIARQLGVRNNIVSVMMWRIKHPDTHNAASLATYRKRRAQLRGTQHNSTGAADDVHR